MKNKVIGFVAGIILITLGYFAVYPLIAKRLFFNQFDYIQNPIIAARERKKKRFEGINPTVLLAIVLMIGVDLCLISLKNL